MLFSLVYFLVGRVLATGRCPREGRDIELLVLRHQVRVLQRQARVAQSLAEAALQTCRVTLLACHAVPPGMTPDDWVQTVCDELIPAVSAERLVDAVDVNADGIAFSLGHLEQVAIDGLATDAAALAS